LNLGTIIYFHLHTHAYFKRTLFLCAGIIIHCHYGNQDSRYKSFQGLDLFIFSTSIMALVLFCFYMSSCNLVSLYFTRGFISKEIFMSTAFSARVVLVTAIALLLIMTYIYTLKLIIFTASTLAPVEAPTLFMLAAHLFIGTAFYKTLIMHTTRSSKRAKVFLLLVLGLLTLQASQLTYRSLLSYSSTSIIALDASLLSLPTANIKSRV
jgi:NADH:ubiquinone oxidoreductase subunit 5 (subunit L)/multisubunit Na+/H+ antiporter MnhA subunit